MKIQALGEEWLNSSLVWGLPCGSGDIVEARSPIDTSVVQRVSTLNREELACLLSPDTALTTPSPTDLRSFCIRLSAALEEMRDSFSEATLWETAFLPGDCEEMVDGTLLFLKEYCEVKEMRRRLPAAGMAYQDGPQERRIELLSIPWGTVAVILPQNAFLFLAVSSMVNAIAAGNRVILRAPLQSARSAGLLAEAVVRAGCSDVISIVQVSAKTFTAALYQSSFPCLLHYMGSSRHAPAIASEAFQNGKACLIDGDGNGWMWIDRDVDIEGTVCMLIESALRYNGQTCTSTNGVIIHPDLFPQLRDRLFARWSCLQSGDPRRTSTQVGPLLDEAQAKWCQSRIESSGAKARVGGRREGNLLAPTLLESPECHSDLVREGAFGPILWIAPGNREDFTDLWRSNRYPLSASVCSCEPEPEWWASRLGNLARLVINGDPSIEHVHAPWGGYPSAGMNPVNDVSEKYRRILQLDAPATNLTRSRQ